MYYYKCNISLEMYKLPNQFTQVVGFYLGLKLHQCLASPKNYNHDVSYYLPSRVTCTAVKYCWTYFFSTVYIYM